MMSDKPLDGTLGACSLWSPLLLPSYIFLFLAVCAVTQAGADTIPDKSSIHVVSVSEDIPGVDKSSPASDIIPNSSVPSESTPPLAPDIPNDQSLNQMQAVTPNQNLHLDGDMRLRPGFGTVVQRGMASWYGSGFHGRKSADGERFNMYSMTAAHPNLPLHSWVLVRNVRNNKVALLKVTDRGPYRSKRILDVSYAAAKQLDFIRSGTAQVEVRQLSQSEVSWVRRQLDEGSEMSAEERASSSVDASYESAVKVQQIIRYDDK
ncbi:septal ring lytic transglycosylase RlpA family protein [Collimonas humicola]|uniref:septal ring lytic transglycosylase RlpA family protein n=1 Tax=Collimonas humicola TaxID=2825886 RepID=UPI001E5C770F|nr:septal ring lytic transglycosylase RlpA family protein [Collimonas humicola]